MMNNLFKVRIILTSLCVILIGTTCSVRAHHSALANFDSSRTVVIEGTVTEVKMLNPHASIAVDIVTDSGETEEWLVELVSKNALIRLKFDMDRFKIGSQVKFSGWPGRRDKNIYFLEAVFPDGTVIKKKDTFGQPLL